VAADDPGVLANAAVGLAYFGEDIGAMIGMVDRALTLNPSFARGWLVSARLRCWAGQLDAAAEHAETSLRLSPRVRIGPSLAVIGYADFLSRRFNEAVPKLRLAIQEDPTAPNAYRYLAASYAFTGRLEEAREVIQQLLAVNPVVVPNVSFLRNPEHRELFLSGLRLAAGRTT
jgi:tetratricopeptide (TPR) repeat protein